MSTGASQPSSSRAAIDKGTCLVASVAMEAAALSVSIIALLAAGASAFYARASAAEARRSNELEKLARSTAIHIVHRKTYDFWKPPDPDGPLRASGFYPSALPRSKFDADSMYLANEITVVNMGPGTCYRMRLALDVSGSNYHEEKRAQLLPPGDELKLKQRLSSYDLPSDLRLTVTWRDELAQDQKVEFGLDESGYFEGVGDDFHQRDVVWPPLVAKSSL